MAQTLTSFWLARGRGVVDTGLTPAQTGGGLVPPVIARFDSSIIKFDSNKFTLDQKAA